jgi:hypothetical protein
MSDQKNPKKSFCSWVDGKSHDDLPFQLSTLCFIEEDGKVTGESGADPDQILLIWKLQCLQFIYEREAKDTHKDLRIQFDRERSQWGPIRYGPLNIMRIIENVRTFIAWCRILKNHHEEDREIIEALDSIIKDLEESIPHLSSTLSHHENAQKIQIRVYGMLAVGGLLGLAQFAKWMVCPEVLITDMIFSDRVQKAIASFLQ